VLDEAELKPAHLALAAEDGLFDLEAIGLQFVLPWYWEGDAHFREQVARLREHAEAPPPPGSKAQPARPLPRVLERAVPCGLILNELITNAIKHGRSADGLARVSLQVASTPDGFAFSVRDQGPGWKRTPGVRSGVSIGQDLVEALVHQLRATMTVTVDGGTTVRIDVPEAPDFNAPTAAASRR
jgi:nitrate/nitrite-specific signal transduction histidine kinase